MKAQRKIQKKKISLARFQSVKFRCNTAWKTVACMLVLWKNALITNLLLRRFVFRKVELRRATGDERQGTMGRVQTAGEARCLLRAFLRAHISIERETSGYEAALITVWLLSKLYSR